VSISDAERLKALVSRRVPPLGGFNLTFLYLEMRRLVRNRRTVILTLVMPIALFFLFRSSRRLGGANTAELTASTMIGIGVYGAMLAATAGGALVSVERALGWSRQLRLTPLRPVAYIAIKLLNAMLLGLVSVALVYAAGVIDGVHMSTQTWVLTGVLAWAAALVFASFGLFIGYLMPYMPPYGVAQIARFPLVGGSFDVTWILSLVLWTAAFSAGAMYLFRRDTRRT